MITDIKGCVTLSNGVNMPQLGFGVWRVDSGSQVYEAVGAALRAGYSMIDTAQNYRNEAGVGRAINDSGIPRDEIFVTTKVDNKRQGYDRTLRAYDESLDEMGLDYVDLFLIHWPMSSTYVQTWRALIRLYEQKRVRAIGVSNFHEHHLDNIIKDSSFVPMVNQVECHPLLTQKPLKEYCEKLGIQFESYSPLMRGNLDMPLLRELSLKHGKSPAQVVLRWHLQSGSVVIPKSVTEKRIIENSLLFDFELPDSDMQAIDCLNKEQRFLESPDNFPFDR